VRKNSLSLPEELAENVENSAGRMALAYHKNSLITRCAILGVTLLEHAIFREREEYVSS